MDGQQQQRRQVDQDAAARQVAEGLQLIKAQMPETYRAVQAKAGEIGGDAYRLVREALRGVPSRFYAIEAGHVVGTPFDMPDVTADLARVMVQFGCRHLIMWAAEAQQHKGVGDGTH